MKPGQKVVCIDDRVPLSVRNLYTHWIKEGTTYVVRDVFDGSAPGQANAITEIGITLLGLVNPIAIDGMFLGRERGYNARRFKPIEEREHWTERQAELEV